MTSESHAPAVTARSRVASIGVRIVENVQITKAYWLPVDRVLVVPPGMSEEGWQRVETRLLSPIPRPRQGR